MWKESKEKDKIDKVEKKREYRDIRHVLQDWIPKFWSTCIFLLCYTVTTCLIFKVSGIFSFFFFSWILLGFCPLGFCPPPSVYYWDFVLPPQFTTGILSPGILSAGILSVPPWQRLALRPWRRLLRPWQRLVKRWWRPGERQRLVRPWWRPGEALTKVGETLMKTGEVLAKAGMDLMKAWWGPQGSRNFQKSGCPTGKSH